MRVLSYDKCKWFPDLSPSTKLSYLLGVKYGDMVLGGSQYRVALCVKDIDFAEEFAYCLGSILDTKVGVTLTKRGYYWTMVKSRVLHDYFMLSLDMHITQIKEYPSPFLRGFFDSEGGITGNGLHAACVDKNVLEYCEKLLSEDFSIRSKIHSYESYKKLIRSGRATKMLYTLCVYGRGNLETFFYEIGFSILRKQIKLGELIGYAN